MDELDYWLRLTRVPNLDADSLRTLLTRFDSLEALCMASAKDLSETGLTAGSIERLQKFDAQQLKNDRAWVSKPTHAFISCNSSSFPLLVGQLTDAPIGLFVRGNLEAMHRPQLAVVGARNPTTSGRQTAEAFAAHLARCGLIITSGLAAGIDAAAHHGALRAGGATIAVCATGLDIVYPNDHVELAEAICEQGALISEFPPGTQPLRYHFPQRNRLISGLSIGTLVVEAALRSGSLITAKFAAEQGREVFAIPGSIHNPLARGCHQLLRQGAKLVESAEDILGELGPLAATLRDHAPRVPQLSKAIDSTPHSTEPLDKDYKILLDAVGFEAASVDQLVARTGFKAETVASMLLILELDGRIVSNLSGMYYLAPV